MYLLCLSSSEQNLQQYDSTLAKRRSAKASYPGYQSTRMFESASVPHFHPKDGKLAAIYSYNHYNLSFSYIMITVITSNEDMLDARTTVNLINYITFK